jgi:peptide/nickel transport system substrate-binding protein
LSILSYQKIDELKQRKDTQILEMYTPRYFAVFFNVIKSKPLASDRVRKALSFATDRQTIVNDVFGGHATVVTSPILGHFGQFTSNPEAETYSFDREKAEEILEEAGWKKQDDGSRKKDEQPLEISLITTQWPDLDKTAEVLKQQWQNVGAKVNVENLSITDIQQNYIKPREYQSILFGQEYFGNDPDPYYFWHSSGKKDPGRNIAVYDNQEVDKLLESARTINDGDQRKQQYSEFEKKIMDDAPAVFLYSPNFVYVINKKIQGVQTSSIINPPYRFEDASHWYIKTKRIAKDDQSRQAK